ncbi:MAG: TrkA family potassium uptake protein [Candidatus Erginobacter occultus]|nr:TrkA family potassium uptake protein [Candidatus Erginobacter occultus]
MKQFVVIGAGRFGSAVAVTLAQKGKQVMVIDQDEQTVQRMSEIVTQAIQLDVTDPRSLADLDLGEMDVAVIGIGGNLEASILTTMQLKEMGVKIVVAKAKTNADKKILSRIGADRIVFPERDMGIRVANSLVSPTIFDYIQVSPGFGIVETRVPDAIQGQTLTEANIRSRFGIDIVAIRRRAPQLDKKGESQLKDTMLIAPRADEILGKNDILVIIGEEGKIEKFKSL